MMRKYTIDEIHAFANKRGLKCLSDTYNGIFSKLKWQCAKGHIWERETHGILSGDGCPYCAGIAKLTIEEMQKLAEKKGGRCLSKIYVNNRTKLCWMCKEGHIWETTPDNVKSGKWCPICSEGISERTCLKIFEKMFNQRFLKKKPQWLISPTGTRMELDGYCEKLGLAFEYQGVQHYKKHNFFQRDRSLKEQKGYDERKRKLCQQHNVILIEVPYHVNKEQMYGWIINECFKKGVEIPEEEWVEYKNLNIYSPEKLKELQDIARAKGGICLSTAYIGQNNHLEWMCKEGHTWYAMPSNVKSGSWCPQCANNVRAGIEDVKDFVLHKGWTCLSKEYKNNRTKLKFKCELGHEFENSFGHIKMGQGCPYCSKCALLTIEEMEHIAKSKKGLCLSKVYVNNHTKLTWQCKLGHVWDATPQQIKRGQWCPYCPGKKRKV